jgi:hypothetical protein
MGRKLTGTGYKRPPREHSWKKGECGNPKGRPRGHRNLASALTAVLHESVSMPVDGDEREMTKLEAVTRQLVDRAVNGDPRLMRELLAEIHKNETQAERDASLEPLDDINREVLEALYVRVRCEAAKRE